MVWLEKYIELANYYPNDWQNRKQLDNSIIKRQDVNTPERAEKSLSNRLLVFRRALEDDIELPLFREELRNELKEQFYQWINSTGINFNNCPERLKHFLVGVHEILEGGGEKFEKDAENKKRELDPDSQEYAEELNKIFAAVQTPLQNEREVSESLTGKKSNEITLKDKIEGNAELGKQVFERIARNHDYKDFYFFPQKEQQARERGLDEYNR